MTNVTIDPNDHGWQGPHRVHASEFGRLITMLRELDRRLQALERAAPLRASQIRLDPSGMYVDGVLEVPGTTRLGSATSIAGVGMNTFITQQQAVRSEVLSARGPWPDIGTRMTQISTKADDVQAEVTSARGSHANLGTRMSAISSKGDDALSTANAVQSEVTTARSGSASLNARITAHRAALQTVVNKVDDILDRLDDLDNKGIGQGTWPPVIPG